MQYIRHNYSAVEMLLLPKFKDLYLHEIFPRIGELWEEAKQIANEELRKEAKEDSQ